MYKYSMLLITAVILKCKMDLHCLYVPLKPQELQLLKDKLSHHEIALLQRLFFVYI